MPGGGPGIAAFTHSYDGTLRRRSRFGRNRSAMDSSPVPIAGPRLTGSQAHRLTGSQAHRLTGSQAHRELYGFSLSLDVEMRRRQATLIGLAVVCFLTAAAVLAVAQMLFRDLSGS